MLDEIFKTYSLPDSWRDLVEEVDTLTEPLLQQRQKLTDHRSFRMLQAFQEVGLSQGELWGTTGYGLGDIGREKLERVFALVFDTQEALVRQQFVSGTHALRCCLFGSLKPGQTLLSGTGAPYDTLLPVIGAPKNYPGSLKEWGVNYDQVELSSDFEIDLEALAQKLRENPLVGAVFLQRSRGYTWRPSLSVAKLKKAIEVCKDLAPQAAVIVDNCYGEMVEELEPTSIGADLIAGSLIKNMGAGLLESGGYIAGQKEWVERAASQYSAPGIGGEQGPSLAYNLPLARALFMAPQIVGQALSGAIWASALYEKFGWEVSPTKEEERTCIIQAIRLGAEKFQKAFCLGAQRAGAIDHRAVPESWVQPGYRHPILMAGGTFVQGSSIELSADGPVREPYACYLQGGLHLLQIKIAALLSLHEIEKAKQS